MAINPFDSVSRLLSRYRAKTRRRRLVETLRRTGLEWYRVTVVSDQSSEEDDVRTWFPPDDEGYGWDRVAELRRSFDDWVEARITRIVESNADSPREELMAALSAIPSETVEVYRQSSVVTGTSGGEDYRIYTVRTIRQTLRVPSVR